MALLYILMMENRRFGNKRLHLSFSLIIFKSKYRYLRAETKREKDGWLIRLTNVQTIVKWLEDFEKIKVLQFSKFSHTYTYIHTYNFTYTHTHTHLSNTLAYQGAWNGRNGHCVRTRKQKRPKTCSYEGNGNQKRSSDDDGTEGGRNAQRYHREYLSSSYYAYREGSSLNYVLSLSIYL